jgi:hypothetical protein
MSLFVLRGLIPRLSRRLKGLNPEYKYLKPVIFDKMAVFVKKVQQTAC